MKTFLLCMVLSIIIFDVLYLIIFFINSFLESKNKVICESCGKEMFKKDAVEFGNLNFCSHDCLVGYCKDVSTKDLIALHNIDKERKGY